MLAMMLHTLSIHMDHQLQLRVIYNGMGKNYIFPYKSKKNQKQLKEKEQKRSPTVKYVSS